MMELIVRPWQMDRPAVARKYGALLMYLPHLILADVTRQVVRWVVRLRVRCREK